MQALIRTIEKAIHIQTPWTNFMNSSLTHLIDGRLALRLSSILACCPGGLPLTRLVLNCIKQGVPVLVPCKKLAKTHVVQRHSCETSDDLPAPSRTFPNAFWNTSSEKMLFPQLFLDQRPWTGASAVGRIVEVCSKGSTCDTIALTLSRSLH